MGDLTIRLLAELIDLPYTPPSIRQLPLPKRREYHKRAVEKSRKKVAAALSGGTVLPTREHIRAALTDAALEILLANGEGVETIRNAFRTVFGDTADVALRKATSGRIGARFLDLA
ncbi:hypothetical protein GAO09_08550 [Rhizobiales bacterium RZME27]|uniref:Uncharacterized protein n=1 Tax=Endobacterium cereale TaxID=2663029 RepID=A0A6A8A621_9HYPH|nr:hypothetical protein [Endobacterium cereale]MQY46104.1 hypothetical protein [Endobacterium cereale]